MPSFRTSTVIEVLEQHDDIQVVRTERGKAILYPRYAAFARPGDSVVLNTTAVDLELGSGGFDFVVWNLAAESHDSASGGHVMKLRYTPAQADVAEAERSDARDDVDGVPVVAMSVHSQLLPVVAGARLANPGVRVAYVMTDGGALEAGFSNVVRRLRDLEWLAGVVTAGHAVGGDLEAVNVYSALGLARHVMRADLIVAGMGPGVVGTRTRLGNTGIEQGTIVNAVSSLGGHPVVAARMSQADERERHRGLDAHTVAALAVALAPADVPIPEGTAPDWHGRHRFVEVDADGVLEALAGAESLGLRGSVMGRTPQQDPLFFLAAGVAGRYAAALAT